jgi:hypothetical protein
MRVFGLFILLVSFVLPLAAQQQQPATAAFTHADAENLVLTLEDSLQGRNLKLFLSVFDRDQMVDYGNFADHVTALFARTDGFRLSLHVTDMDDTGNGHAALAIDTQMEMVPRDSSHPDRRETTLRVQLVKSGNAWRIVELAPREFFY